MIKKVDKGYIIYAKNLKQSNLKSLKDTNF